jgi:hypothetical protein
MNNMNLLGRIGLGLLKIFTALALAGLVLRAEAADIPPQPPKPEGNQADLTKTAKVHGMEITLDHRAMFHANDPLVFTLKLRNISDRDLSFLVLSGINGTSIGKMTWKVEDVKSTTIWKAVANPNPGPMPGMPERMEIRTLKPGESFDAAVGVLRWGQMFGTETEPMRTAFTLPAGKYVASVSVSVNADGQIQGRPNRNWEGAFALKSGEFEVSVQPRPVPVKVRQTREQIIARARESLAGHWKWAKEHKLTPVQELDLAELQAAEMEVAASPGKGLEQGQTIYEITFVAPFQKLGGKVRFHWGLNEFGDERSMSGAQLIKE